MPKRNIHFIWRQRGQNEEDEIIRKQNSFQKEKPYTTLEFRIPKDRWEWENNTSDFFERYPDKENDHQLHPLRKQYLENRLKDIDYQERQQAAQDDFTTRMYGKKDYTEEKNNIINELNRNSTQERTSQQNKTPLASKEENFTPAPPDEPSDFDRRKKLWEEQNKWDEFQKSQHKGQSVARANEPNAFERWQGSPAIQKTGPVTRLKSLDNKHRHCPRRHGTSPLLHPHPNRPPLWHKFHWPNGKRFALDPKRKGVQNP